ncbi:hypothetical protein Tco_0784470 [Tanacetum coccineum]
MSDTNNTMQTQTSNALHNASMKAGVLTTPKSPDVEGSLQPLTEKLKETYKTVSADIQNQLDVKAEVVQIILTGIDNDIYSTVDACPNAIEMWKSIERLKQGESINVQDLETNLYWEFGKFTSRDGESLDSYYSRDGQEVIIEQRVKDDKKARILELKRRNHEDHCSDNLYIVSIKDDTASLCLTLHSATTKKRSIHHIQMKPCTGSPKSILAIKFAWSLSPNILTIGSLSSILDEWGFRGLPRWHLVFSRVGLSWEGDSFVIGCRGRCENDKDDE